MTASVATVMEAKMCEYFQFHSHALDYLILSVMTSAFSPASLSPGVDMPVMSC